MRDRGQVVTRRTSLGDTKFMVTVHPSSVLRTPEDGRDAAYQALVADLRVAAGLLG
jgi:DNA polymerase